jgi:RHS repeat-associated protein
VTGVTPPGRPTHGFTYGAGDLPKTYTAPLGGVTQYAYDEDAELKTVTRPDGELVAYERDVAGRLASVTTGAGVLEYAYDGAGRVGGVTAPGGVTLTHSYDGDLLTGTEWAGPVAGRVERTYDADFRVKTQSVNGVAGVAYAYDEDGLMTGAGDLTLARDAATGQVTGTTLGVVTDAWTYTALGEAATYTVTAGGTPVYGVAFVRDGLGRITGKTETVAGMTAAWVYAYDLAGRLVTVSKDGAVVEEYAYDLNGNRISGSVGGTTTNSTYDGEDRLITAGARTYTHSANGELKTVTEGADTWTYGYDALGNLRTAALPSGTTIEYVIDGRNRRVGRKVNGVLTKGYLWSSGLRVEAELDGGGNVTARYVYGLKSNVPEWLLKGGEKYRIITDHLGSPRLVVNATNGAIVQRMDYDAWGNITNDSNPGFQPFGFAGGLYDQDTKLTRFGARDYDAETGRWTAKDPIGFNGGNENLYAYVNNDPINRTDPFGLWYIDINISGGYWGGASFGVLIGSEGLFPYFGGGVVSPGAGVSINWSPSDPTTGWGVGVQATAGVSGQFGYSFGPCGGKYWEIGGGWPPGFSITGYYVFNPWEWPWK